MVAALASGGGCLGEDENAESSAGGAADQEEDSALRRQRAHRRKPGTAGAPGTDAGLSGAGCEICTRAQACCEAVKAANGSSMQCLFDGATCSGRSESVQGCKTFLTVVIDAWGGNPPAPCLGR
jgi:hypothetical protein